MTVEQVAEQAIKTLLNLQDKFERGEIRWQASD
jgi:hypothetical protein